MQPTLIRYLYPRFLNMNYKNFLLFIFSTLRTDVADCRNDGEMDYVFSLRKVKKITEETNAYRRYYLKKSNICSLNDAELARICILALTNCLLEKYAFSYNDVIPVDEPKVYRLHVSHFKEDEFIQACKCPSEPPIYLTDRKEKNKKIYRSLIKFRKTKKRRKFDSRFKIGVTLLVDKAVGVDGKLKRIFSVNRSRPLRLSRKEFLRMEESIIANCS